MVFKKIWLFSEVYYPDEAGGAYFMTKLSEGLKRRYNSVNVLCGYPYYDQKKQIVPKKEIYNGVNVLRCNSTRFNKNVVFYRLFNLFTMYKSNDRPSN